jgi:hypothetical protein
MIKLPSLPKLLEKQAKLAAEFEQLQEEQARAEALLRTHGELVAQANQAKATHTAGLDLAQRISDRRTNLLAELRTAFARGDVSSCESTGARIAGIATAIEHAPAWIETLASIASEKQQDADRFAADNFGTPEGASETRS